MKLKIILTAVILICFSIVARTTSPAQNTRAPRRIEVTAKRFSFDPAEITVKRGEPVLLVLKSLDVAHGIRFRELNVEVDARAGKTSQVQFAPEKTGDFIGHCSVFCGAGHGSMMLKLHVVE